MGTHLSLFLSYAVVFLLVFPVLNTIVTCQGFSIKEATIVDVKHAFKKNQLTSRLLVEFYLNQIRKLNPIVHGVIEVNPDALEQADTADKERREKDPRSLSELHGIPILLKDIIATKDKLNTTAGSFALLGSVVPGDAGVVKRLRRAGAIILGKASLSEWSGFRTSQLGWSGRGGQSKNPYVLSVTPCGSSSGSAITVAADMVMVSLGSETDGSIICPASINSVVGIKPTVGLTSRGGVIPLTPRQDTIGPFGRTVADAVHVLDVIVGFDSKDAKATGAAAKFIPINGYKKFLNADGIKGKRLGIVRNLFWNVPEGSIQDKAYKAHINTLRHIGAIVIDNLEIANINITLNQALSGEYTAMLAEFKLSLNAYLRGLVSSPVRSLADLIAFNNKYSAKEKIAEYGQDTFLMSQKTNGIGMKERKALLNMKKLSRDGFERLMSENKLDALVAPGFSAISILAIGGYPGISVPAGYETDGTPFGICFGGLRGSEPKLIQIAYAFEQATKIRKPPSFRP